MAVKGRKRERAAVLGEQAVSDEENVFVGDEAGEPIKKRTKKPLVDAEAEMEEQCGRRRSKRAGAAICHKDEIIELDDGNCQIAVKKERIADREETAILHTATPGEGSSEPPSRRLVDFIVHDDDGKAQPIESVDSNALYISAVVLPEDGPAGKQAGMRCEGFGQLESWSITGYEDRKPVVWLSTAIADYICEKPAGEYKRHFDALYDKALMCVEVYRALSKPDGGNPDASLDDVIAHVSRALSLRRQKSRRMAAPAQKFGREYILSLGELIWDQLTGLDESASDAEQLFNGLPALVSLKEAADVRSALVKDCGLRQLPKPLTIKGGGSTDPNPIVCALTAEEARLFQKYEKMCDDDERKWIKSTKRAPATAGAGKGIQYIKINEDEIAADYPLPAYYKATEGEMDEYILFDDDVSELLPDELPRRMLHDWALYNSDFRLISLELLPMLAGTETDVEIFGSGLMTDDDGSGFERGGSHTSRGTATDGESLHGIRIYLSAVKEWMIEFGASMLFISIRTDGAWYRLGNPSEQYLPWYTPVLRTAELAINIITMLQEELRVSRLSFMDVIKKLSEQPSDACTFVSSKLAEVERYVVVHGQIILQQFAEYPDSRIRNSSFIAGLSSKMEQRHHTKLSVSKKKTIIVKKGRNLNPRAYLGPDVKKQKAMRATTTGLVNMVWSSYYTKHCPESEETEKLSEQTCIEEEEACDEDSEAEEDMACGMEMDAKSKPLEPKKSRVDNSALNSFKWVGNPEKSVGSKLSLCQKAHFNGEEICTGAAVLVDQKADQTTILLVEYLYETTKGLHMLHGRVLERGTRTVLGNASDEREVFLVPRCMDIEVEKVTGTIALEMRKRQWAYASRKANTKIDEMERAVVLENDQKGLPLPYFCRSLYCADKGAFFRLPTERLGKGDGTCQACEERHQDDLNGRIQVVKDGFRFKGITYLKDEYVYVDPDSFQSRLEDSIGTDKVKASRNRGLRAFAICQLLDFQSGDKPSSLSIRRFYKPEDLGAEKAYKADLYEVYYSEELAKVDIQKLRGKCEVRRPTGIHSNGTDSSLNNVFSCSCIYDPKAGTVKQLPPNIKLSSRVTSGAKVGSEHALRAKGKGKMGEGCDDAPKKDHRLATLDIFAGCGGLSEGLQQSGVSQTKWAIEYDRFAADAFKLNHPEAHVFCGNCNVMLRSIMEKGGDLDDCISTPEAAELSTQLSCDERDKLPLPGEVDFINGGPPCQGFSGMNRFSNRVWSKIQCEMILSFLGYADYYRPRYFLLENVRNFVSFNKGQTFRLTLATLLEMGYQVRFGVLQAGNYGVSQSRKRAFIWAASPDESLPEWPEPRHVFASSQLKVSMPGGMQYAAVADAALGAPLRSMTVRDTIGDLPAVENGAKSEETKYGNNPESWFQRHIRGGQNTLLDHVCKEMNELNHIRCKRIPKRPGADWRDLPEEKVKLSTGALVDLIPWCLPNTAARHNQWKGLFGRLDWQGNFPTSVTDPQPMGKVGLCFHPEQDRIVSVRECARSQGFPDSYKFCGNINFKHRQIGNAVPPPLARALGNSLREAIESNFTR